MANIKTIIDELETICNAYAETETFIFDELSAINDQVEKPYPAILVNSRSVDSTTTSFNNSYLPRKKNYTLQIYFLDTYKQNEQDTTDRQTKYAELETIADKYLAEVKRRSVDNYKNFEFSNGSTGFIVDKLHNHDLVQVFYTITFSCDNVCNLGTFNY